MKNLTAYGECFGGPLDGKVIGIHSNMAPYHAYYRAFPWPFGWYYFDGNRWNWHGQQGHFIKDDWETVLAVAKENNIKIPFKFDSWKGWIGT